MGVEAEKPGPQHPVRNEDIHVGQRKRDCACSLRTILRSEYSSRLRDVCDTGRRVCEHSSGSLGNAYKPRLAHWALEPHFGVLGLTLAHLCFLASPSVLVSGGRRMLSSVSVGIRVGRSSQR